MVIWDKTRVIKSFCLQQPFINNKSLEIGGGGKKAGNYPEGYLSNGYFTEDGHIKSELLMDNALSVADSFTRDMKYSQLRRFYTHVKTAEKAYDFTKDKEKLIRDIQKMDSFVAEASKKDKVTGPFYKFIRENVSAIKTKKDVLEGFIPHFQSVVAYFTYKYPRSN